LSHFEQIKGLEMEIENLQAE